MCKEPIMLNGWSLSETPFRGEYKVGKLTFFKSLQFMKQILSQNFRNTYIQWDSIRWEEFRGLVSLRGTDRDDISTQFASRDFRPCWIYTWVAVLPLARPYTRLTPSLEGDLVMESVNVA